MQRLSASESTVNVVDGNFGSEVLKIGHRDKPEPHRTMFRSTFQQVLGFTAAPPDPGAATLSTLRGCSSMVEHQLPKLNTGVRFSVPALVKRPSDLQVRSGGLSRFGQGEALKRMVR